MNTKQAAICLSALGHEARLTLFRFLVRAGHEGVSVGQIVAHLGLPPSTVAHHLSALVDSELVQQERQGREIRSYANYELVDGVIRFLNAECCLGIDQDQLGAA